MELPCRMVPSDHPGGRQFEGGGLIVARRLDDARPTSAKCHKRTSWSRGGIICDGRRSSVGACSASVTDFKFCSAPACYREGHALVQCEANVRDTMSAIGTFRTSHLYRRMSAIEGKADMTRTGRYVG